MKCEKCGNEYPSQYYFATANVCNECFSRLSDEEQLALREMAQSLYNTDDLELRAGFGIRLGAYLLDFLIYMILFGIAFFATGIFNEFKDSFVQMLTNPDLMKEFTASIMPIQFIITFMYYSLEIVLAATPGKLILGLQIADENRKSAKIQKLFIRFLGKHLESLVSLIAFMTAIVWIGTIGSVISLIILIGCFFVLGKNRQAFHDMLAKTAVYKKENLKDENNNL